MKKFSITTFLVLLILMLSTNCCRQVAHRAPASSEELVLEEAYTDEDYYKDAEIYYDVDGDGIPDAEDIDPTRIEIPRDEVDAIVDELNSRDLEEELVPMSGEEQPLLMEFTPDEGTLVYKIDSVLIVGVPSKAEARIIQGTDQQNREHLIEVTTKTSTGVVIDTIIQVGNIMDMSLTTLSPEAITIEEIIGDDQNITENTKGYWVWSLQANETGRYNLILVASIQNSNSTNYVEVFDKIINVKNKPKKKFKIFLQFPEGLKRYDENIIKLDVLEYFSDAYSFEWGGEGKIVLEFDGKVDIITDENIINDKKSGFSYKWTVIPEGKEKVLPYTIKIIGDYEDLVIVEHTIPIQKNFKEGSKRFIDNVLKRWYWVFTALIIPISGFIRKKYFKKK